MKKILGLAALLLVMGLYAPVKAEEPWGYALYGEYTSPADFTIPNAKKAPKVGCATCKSIFFVKLGDCSITSAMKNGGISTVTYADWEKTSVLGLVNKKTLKVYGN